MTLSPNLQKLARAMHDPETWVCRIVYRDSRGRETTRTVSPIRFPDRQHVLALCLGREEPRSFVLANILAVDLQKSDDVLMPVPIEERR